MSFARLWIPTLIITAASALAEPEVNGSYELKNRSAFAVADTVRPPFWPIGWEKRKAVVVTPGVVAVAPKVVLDAAGFNLTSILGGPPALALINGKSYAEGEYLRLPKTAPLPRIQVARISERTVQLRSADGQTVIITLKSQEIESKKTEEDLLSGDR